MAIAPFLAMTAAEMYATSSLPSKIAWMACHFSPYGLGLSNLPKELPPGSLLMVDDMTPPHGHDPVLIAEQLSICVESLQCCGVLLDFQRIGCEESLAIAKSLSASLPCPVVVSEQYANHLSCPVFLSPLPPSAALETYLLPWKGREVWLDLGTDGECITLTENGAQIQPHLYPDMELSGFHDHRLFCHYTILTDEKSAEFTLWRTGNDLKELLAEAETLGVSGAVGLYQELNRFPQQ